MLNTKDKVEMRLTNLVEELVERLEEDRADYNRVAKGLTLGANMEMVGHVSRAGQLHSYDVTTIFKEAFNLLSRLNNSSSKSGEWSPPLLNISISASKFDDISSINIKPITNFFSPSNSRLSSYQNPPVGINKSRSKESDRQTFVNESSGLNSNNIVAAESSLQKNSAILKSFFKTKIIAENKSDLARNHSHEPKEPVNSEIKENNKTKENNLQMSSKEGEEPKIESLVGESVFRSKLRPLLKEYSDFNECINEKVDNNNPSENSKVTSLKESNTTLPESEEICIDIE